MTTDDKRCCFECQNLYVENGRDLCLTDSSGIANCEYAHDDIDEWVMQFDLCCELWTPKGEWYYRPLSAEAVEFWHEGITSNGNG